MTFIDEYRLTKFNVRSVLLTWLDYRRDYMRRIYNHRLISKHERRHILETLIFILDGKNGERTIAIAKKANTREEIADKLMKEYKISSLQAKSIAGMRVYEFSKEYVAKYKEELSIIQKDICDLETIVRNPRKVDEIIIEQLKEGMELFGQPRKSKLVNINDDQLIKVGKYKLVFTEMGFVKKLPHTATSIGSLKLGDIPTEIKMVDNSLSLLVFDDTGKIVKLPVADIPTCDIKSNGHQLSTLNKSIQGKVVSIKPLPSEKMIKKIGDTEILFITKNGISKKTKFAEYLNIKNDLVGITIKDGDKLASVKIYDKNKDILVYTSNGYGMKIKSKDIKQTTRIAIGSR